MWPRLSRRVLKRQVDEELGFHLEMLAKQYRAKGMDPVMAREAAEARFGDPSRIQPLFSMRDRAG